MLGLLQIIQHMLVHLEYSETEVREAFEAVERGELDLIDLLDCIGVELNTTVYQLTRDKLNRWPSALAVVKMRV